MSKSVLKGTIASVAVTVEDQATGDVIRSDCVYLHVYEKNRKIVITALLPEGTYLAEFTELDLLRGRKRSERTTDDEWITAVKSLVSGENNIMKLVTGLAKTLVNDMEKPVPYLELALEGRYVTQKLFYNANGDVRDDDDDDVMPATIMYLDVKTVGKLPITMGSFELQLMGETEMNANPEETNLLNWMDLLIDEARKNKEELYLLKSEMAKKSEALEYYRTELIQATKDHQAIMDDAEQKFYHVLNAKKDKIRELQGDGYEGEGTIPGLNEGYRAKNKFSLEQTILPLADIPNQLRPELERNRRTKRGKGTGGEKKRQKTKKNEERIDGDEDKDEDEDEDEDKDDDEDEDEDEDEEQEAEKYIDKNTDNTENGSSDNDATMGDDDDESEDSDEVDKVDKFNEDNQDDAKKSDIATDGVSENEGERNEGRNKKGISSTAGMKNILQAPSVSIPTIKQEQPSQFSEEARITGHNLMSTTRITSGSTPIQIKQESTDSTGKVLQQSRPPVGHRSGYETEDDPATEIDDSTEIDNSTESESESESGPHE